MNIRFFAVRYCGPREYAARYVLEIASLLATVLWLATVPWYQHQPVLVRAVLAAIPFAIAAASVAMLRRLPEPQPPAIEDVTR